MNPKNAIYFNDDNQRKRLTSFNPRLFLELWETSNWSPFINTDVYHIPFKNRNLVEKMFPYENKKTMAKKGTKRPLNRRPTARPGCGGGGGGRGVCMVRSKSTSLNLSCVVRPHVGGWWNIICKDQNMYKTCDQVGTKLTWQLNNFYL